MRERVAAGEVASLKPNQLRREALSVLRYDIRMRTRPTPFDNKPDRETRLKPSGDNWQSPGGRAVLRSGALERTP